MGDTGAAPSSTRRPRSSRLRSSAASTAPSIRPTPTVPRLSATVKLAILLGRHRRLPGALAPAAASGSRSPAPRRAVLLAESRGHRRRRVSRISRSVARRADDGGAAGARAQRVLPVRCGPRVDGADQAADRPDPSGHRPRACSPGAASDWRTATAMAVGASGDRRRHHPGAVRKDRRAAEPDPGCRARVPPRHALGRSDEPVVDRDLAAARVLRGAGPWCVGSLDDAACGSSGSRASWSSATRTRGRSAPSLDERHDAWAFWRVRRASLPMVLASCIFAIHAYTVLSVQVHENHFYLALPLIAAAGAAAAADARTLCPREHASACCNLFLYPGASAATSRCRSAGITIRGRDACMVSFVNVGALIWHARRFAAGCSSEQAARPAAVDRES